MWRQVNDLKTALKYFLTLVIYFIFLQTYIWTYAGWILVHMWANMSACERYQEETHSARACYVLSEPGENEPFACFPWVTNHHAYNPPPSIFNLFSLSV